MIKSITRRPLWFNILVAIGIVVVLFLIFMFSLNWITRHGASKTVPAVTGKNIDAVQQLLHDKGFETVIQDSVFYDSIPPGMVVKQVPEADAVVKVNRTVYVIINRFVAPDVSVPNLIGTTLRNAQYTLEKLGLHMGDTSSRIDFAKNSIIEMSVAGKEVQPGDKVRMGTKVDLVLARGLGAEDYAVPNLIGKTLSDARVTLEAYGLPVDLEPITGAVRDTSNGFIWQQRPSAKTPDGVQLRIRAGQSITVWLQTEPVVADTTAPAPSPQTP